MGARIRGHLGPRSRERAGADHGHPCWAHLLRAQGFGALCMVLSEQPTWNWTHQVPVQPLRHPLTQVKINHIFSDLGSFTGRLICWEHEAGQH